MTTVRWAAAILKRWRRGAWRTRSRRCCGRMMEQSPVAVGTEVKQGEQIGKVGQTGNSKGAHLDLTITRDGKPIDPATLIPELQDSATGYVWTGSNVYTNVTSGSSQSSGSSGGSSGSSGLKSLDNLLKLDGLF